jgi:hypothetical protein
MVLGREIIIDVEDIENYSLLETIDGIKPLMEKIIENCKLTVVGQCEYQFSPIGATILYYFNARFHLDFNGDKILFFSSLFVIIFIMRFK